MNSIQTTVSAELFNTVFLSVIRELQIHHKVTDSKVTTVLVVML